MLCPEAVLIGKAHGHGVAATLRCKQWDCARCESDNRKRLALLIRDLKPTLFLTFTASPHWGGSPDDRARKLTVDFQNARRRLRRLTGMKIDFVAVFEATRRGEPHLHIAVACCPLRAEVLQRKILEWLGEPNGSRRVKVRPVHDVDGLASYMSKGPHKFDCCKRHWCSLGWRVRRAVEDAGFVLVSMFRTGRAGLDTVEVFLRGQGFEVFARSPRRLHFNPPP